METVKGSLAVLELYSGIGGMHFALKDSGVQFHVVAAIDINQVSNSIYHANFPKTKLLTKCLTRLTLSELNGFGADVVVMSPPCQPFTRVGKQRDMADERTKSFLHFLDLLPKLDKIPDYILLENVKGFETSLTRDVMLEVLEKLDFSFQEFLLTPLQFSIPNSRLRYYFLAKRKPLQFSFELKSMIMTSIPSMSNGDDGSCCLPQTSFKQSSVATGETSCCAKDSSVVTFCEDTSKNFEGQETKFCKECCPNFKSLSDSDRTTVNSQDSHFSNCHNISHSSSIRPLSDFLEDQPAEYFKQFLLPKKFYRYFWVMDLVQKDSRNTCCFTKRYGHHVDGAGSVLQMKPSLTELTPFRGQAELTPECMAEIEARELRLFTPRETANLLCFPLHFCIPESVTTLQSYRALGNSINVFIVSNLLRLLVK